MLKRYALIFGLVLALLLIPTGVVLVLRDNATQATGPLSGWLVRQSRAVRSFFTNLGEIGSLRDEKAALQEEVLLLQQRLAQQENVIRENEGLRAELGVSGVTRDIPKVLAQVVVTDPLDRTYTVNVGSAEGVRIDQPAIFQGVLVGRVIEVREHSALVRSITSQKSRVQAWIVSNREKGLLVGTGNTVVLKEITQGIEIPSDSLVETSGLGGSLPQGILIGTTGATESAKSDLSQSLRVTLTHDLNSLESFFILLSTGQ